MKTKISMTLLALIATAELSAQTGKTTYEYDKLNRLVKVVSPAGETTYTYDEIGNRTSKKFTPNASLQKPNSARAKKVDAPEQTVKDTAVKPAKASKKYTTKKRLSQKSKKIKTQK